MGKTLPEGTVSSSRALRLFTTAPRIFIVRLPFDQPEAPGRSGVPSLARDRRGSTSRLASHHTDMTGAVGPFPGQEDIVPAPGLAHLEALPQTVTDDNRWLEPGLSVRAIRPPSLAAGRARRDQRFE